MKSSEILNEIVMLEKSIENSSDIEDSKKDIAKLQLKSLRELLGGVQVQVVNNDDEEEEEDSYDDYESSNC